MPVISSKSFKSKSFLKYFDNNHNFIIDYPAVIYGKNHSFKSNFKPTKFYIPKLSYCDSIFVSSAESFGVLFLESESIQVYITQPVYDQIILRYKSLPHYCDYDECIDEDNINHQLVDIKNVSLDKFHRRCILVRFNEIINFSLLNVKCITSGTFLGWCNWIFQYRNGNVFYFIRSISFQNRFTFKPDSIVCDFLFINRNKNIGIFDDSYLSPVVLKYDQKDFKTNLEFQTFNESIIQPSILNMQCLQDFLLENIKISNNVIFLVDFTTNLLEILVYVLFLTSKKDLKEINVTVCSSLMKLYLTNVNVHCDWLNNTFFKDINEGSEPFSFEKYQNLRFVPSIFETDAIPGIFFIDYTEHQFISSRFFANQIVVSTIDLPFTYDYKLNADIETSLDSLYEKTGICQIFTNKTLNHMTALKPDSYLSLEDGIEHVNVTIKDSNKIYLQKSHEEHMFYVDCFVVNRDDVYEIQPFKDYLKTIFTENVYFYHEGYYYFMKLGKKIFFEDEKCYVYNLDGIHHTK